MANNQQFTNNAASTLSAGINASVTSITLTAGGGALFPALSGSQYFYGTISNTAGTVNEIVKVTARSTDTLTVVRAQDNTTASSFSAGDNFQLRVTAAAFNNTGQIDSANTWSQTQTMNITGNASGNAGTATKLASAVNIQGVSFDGSAPITVATAGTGISVTGTSIANTGVISVNGSTGVVTGIGGNYVINNYTSPATWTKPATLKAIKVTVVGAGGNGTTGVPGANGAGGGGGGGAILYLSAPSIPGPQPVTAGPGTNSFGALASATAGGSGPVAGTGATAGGAGTASGGLTISGAPSTAAAGLTNGFYGGNGGSSILGLGGRGAVQTGSSPGQPGTGYGGGGGGGGNVPSTLQTAGTGTAGIVIVEEFY